MGRKQHLQDDFLRSSLKGSVNLGQHFYLLQAYCAHASRGLKPTKWMGIKPYLGIGSTMPFISQCARPTNLALVGGFFVDVIFEGNRIDMASEFAVVEQLKMTTPLIVKYGGVKWGDVGTLHFIGELIVCQTQVTIRCYSEGYHYHQNIIQTPSITSCRKKIHVTLTTCQRVSIWS